MPPSFSMSTATLLSHPPVRAVLTQLVGGRVQVPPMTMMCPFSSHAMMDLLVELCLQNHLNPSHHALEIWSSETQQPLSFKPNTLVGTLNVHTVFLKEKVPEEKVKPGPPRVPEVSRMGALCRAVTRGCWECFAGGWGAPVTLVTHADSCGGRFSIHTRQR